MKILCRECFEELDAIMEDKWVVQDCPNGCDAGFIAGTKGLSHIKGKDITCSCDNPSLRMVMHMNMKPRHIYKYKCENCNNTVEMA